jgi:hypothetical protein
MSHDRSGEHRGILRRVLDAIVDWLPGPPGEAPPDPALAGLDELTSEERAARLRAWAGRFRWGRGDGNG